MLKKNNLFRTINCNEKSSVKYKTRDEMSKLRIHVHTYIRSPPDATAGDETSIQTCIT